MKRHIPNIITLGNLTCGILSIISASQRDFEWSAYFIFLGLFLDFFDGFFARILKVDGEIGKQLDSLADMVTFGVAPGLLVYFFSTFILQINTGPIEPSCSGYDNPFQLAYLGFLIPLLSAVRLAKFNISTNQSDQFIGMPTPANAIFFASAIAILANQLNNSNLLIIAEAQYGGNLDLFGKTELGTYILLLLCIPMSILLNINTPLIALKFKTFGWKGNEARFVLLGISLLVILGSLLISNIFVAVPIIILLYLIISVINNFTKRAK